MRVSRIYYLGLMVRDMEATLRLLLARSENGGGGVRGWTPDINVGWQKINLIRAAKTSSSKPTGSYLD